MSTVTHVHVRDARDSLTEILGVGLPYPLRDLAVRDAQLTVAFNTTAKIPIEDSQTGVLYSLYDKGQLVERTETWEAGPGVPIQAEGNGETLYLETYKISDDITFQILATKQQSRLAAYLHETATVKVGLDTTLIARILEVPPLDATQPTVLDDAARIIDYGVSVEVEIVGSQEGVDYQLIYFTDPADHQTETELSVTDVRGDLHNIVLRTQPVYEDLDIHIRATKVFDPSENRPTQTALLDTVLPLKVRANTALAVTVTPIIALGGSATLQIMDTQSSVSYQVYSRTLRDQDFIHGETTADVVTVDVPDEPPVQVANPARGPVWEQPAGFVPVEAAQDGNAGELTFTIADITLDTLLIVQASKAHQTVSDVIPSAVQLEAAVMTLVQPDVDQALRVGVEIIGDQTAGKLHVYEGQPGVFYTFRRVDESVGKPVYFHQRDDQNDQFNKGLDQLRVEVDFVVPRDFTPDRVFDRSQTPPESPITESGPLAIGSELAIEARKAQTRVAIPLSRTAHIVALPDIHLENAIIDYGAFTRIIVVDSVVGERYEPLVNGEQLRRARNGNGEDLSFNTDPLTDNTEFRVLVTGSAEGGIPVERWLRLLVQVRPDLTLTVNPTETIVDYNDSVTVGIEVSQSGVQYQLLDGEEAVGDAATGNGATCSLSTPALVADVVLMIEARKSETVLGLLAQAITITVRPNRELPVTAVDSEVETGAETQIQITDSQAGVNYQLTVDGEPVGDPVIGTGEAILLPTGAINETRLFTVQAIHPVQPEIVVELTQSVSINALSTPAEPDPPDDPPEAP